MVIDAVGGKSFQKSYNSLSSLGRLFIFGVSSLAPGETRSIVAALRGLIALPKFKPITLMNQNRGVFGVNLGHLWNHSAEIGVMLREVIALVAQGILDPHVDEVFPLADAAAAHRYIQA